MLILASSSPRRQELLKNAGVSFEVHPSDVVEVPRDHEKPAKLVERLAWEKAKAVHATLRGTKDFVLGADTIVVVDDEILGKPHDDADAAKMLKLLSGRTHEVITGVCLIGDRFEDVRSETTKVTFCDLRGDEILDYIASREPMDKAGAYGIQGLASRWIPRIEGDYFNVVGLPVSLVYKMLCEHAAL